jgi:DNA-binding NarL/FixJ family response regulator
MPVSVVLAMGSRMGCEILSHALKARRRQITVLAFALTTEELLKKVAQHRPDVTLISANFEGSADGSLRVLRELQASCVTTSPIMMEACSSPGLVSDAFGAGAKGIVCREVPFATLCKAIHCVHEGQIWASSQELKWFLKSLSVKKPVPVLNVLGIPLLTEREEQIVQLVAEGMPSREIALKLKVSAHTVKNHLFRIYEKLGVSTRSELILYVLSSRELKDSS